MEGYGQLEGPGFMGLRITHIGGLVRKFLICNKIFPSFGNFIPLVRVVDFVSSKIPPFCINLKNSSITLSCFYMNTMKYLIKS